MSKTRGKSSVFDLVIIALIAVAVIFVLLRYMPPAGGTVVGGAGIGLTIYYVDGSSETLEAIDRPVWTQLGLPLAIFINDKEIEKLTATMKYEANWVGTLASYEFSGSLNFYVDSAKKGTWTVTNPDAIAKNMVKTILEVDVTADQLSAWASGDGDHTMDLDGALTLDVAFTDSDPAPQTAYDTVSLGFTKTATGGLTIFRIYVSMPVTWK